jgi:hypothetical protein
MNHTRHGRAVNREGAKRPPFSADRKPRNRHIPAEWSIDLVAVSFDATGKVGLTLPFFQALGGAAFLFRLRQLA